jgi:hypothetical protein
MSGLEVITLIILLGVLRLGFDVRREMRAGNRLQANKPNYSEYERMTRASFNAPNKPPAQTPMHRG